MKTTDASEENTDQVKFSYEGEKPQERTDFEVHFGNYKKITHPTQYPQGK